LIGINSFILDHAHIGEGSIIGAGSVVLQGTKIEPGSCMRERRRDGSRTSSGKQAQNEMIGKDRNNYIIVRELVSGGRETEGEDS